MVVPLLLHIAIFCSLCAMCVAQPRLEMQNEQDWGTIVPRGELHSKQSVTAQIPLRNTGDSTLVITGVRVQCGCTHAPLRDTVLAPGASTVMDLKLDLPTGSGVVQKYVTVYSTDPAGAHVLRVKVNVERPIQLSSSFLAFDKTRVGVASRAVLSVTMNADTTATVNITAATPGLAVVTPMPITLTKGASADIEFRYTPTTEGGFSVTAILSASLPGYQLVEISGYGAADPAGK